MEPLTASHGALYSCTVQVTTRVQQFYSCFVGQCKSMDYHTVYDVTLGVRI